ncbi:hypothetical protein V8C34DRAFT_196593 [Trichoderma compactum]
MKILFWLYNCPSPSVLSLSLLFTASGISRQCWQSRIPTAACKSTDNNRDWLAASDLRLPGSGVEPNDPPPASSVTLAAEKGEQGSVRRGEACGGKKIRPSLQGKRNSRLNHRERAFERGGGKETRGRKQEEKRHSTRADRRAG